MRYASWYVEKMGKLPQDHPEIYEKFMQGHFVLKQNSREFNAVAPDLTGTDDTKIKEKCKKEQWRELVRTRNFPSCS